MAIASIIILDQIAVYDRQNISTVKKVKKGQTRYIKTNT